MVTIMDRMAIMAGTIHMAMVMVDIITMETIITDIHMAVGNIKYIVFYP